MLSLPSTHLQLLLLYPHSNSCLPITNNDRTPSAPADPRLLSDGGATHAAVRLAVSTVFGYN